MDFLDMLATLDTIARTNKTLIESLSTALLAQKNQAQPNTTLIALQQAAIASLNEVQANLILTYNNVYDRTIKARRAAELAYNALAAALPDGVSNALLAGLAPPGLPGNAAGAGSFTPKR
jgi:hypothetical protein